MGWLECHEPDIAALSPQLALPNRIAIKHRGRLSAIVRDSTRPRSIEMDRRYLIRGSLRFCSPARSVPEVVVYHLKRCVVVSRSILEARIQRLLRSISIIHYVSWERVATKNLSSSSLHTDDSQTFSSDAST